MVAKESTTTPNRIMQHDLLGRPETASRIESIGARSASSTTENARPSDDAPATELFLRFFRHSQSNPVEERTDKVASPIKIPHRIAGEPFYFEIEDEQVFLRHEIWSLLGTGSSLCDAELDLVEEARQLADVWFDLPIESLDYEAFRLRDFLYRII